MVGLPLILFTIPEDELAGLSIITRDQYAISWKDADGDIMKYGGSGVSRTTAGFTTALITGDEANEEFKGDKVQGNANGAEVIFNMTASKAISSGNLLVRAWRGPTEGTSAGATKVAEFTGAAPSSGAATAVRRFYAILGASEFLMLEWVSATGSPIGGISDVAQVTRG